MSVRGIASFEQMAGRGDAIGIEHQHPDLCDVVIPAAIVAEERGMHPDLVAAALAEATALLERAGYRQLTTWCFHDGVVDAVVELGDQGRMSS